MAPDDQPNAFERASTPWLLRLHALPRWLVALTMAATLVAGLLIRGPVGAALLLLLALFLSWLAAFGWRHLSAGSQVLRVLAIGLICYGAVRVLA